MTFQSIMTGLGISLVLLASLWLIEQRKSRGKGVEPTSLGGWLLFAIVFIPLFGTLFALAAEGQ